MKTMRMFFVFGVLCVVAAGVAGALLEADEHHQSQVLPIHWYRFENASNLGQDSMGNEDLVVGSQVKQSGFAADGIVGNYVNVSRNTSLDLNVPPGESIEFLFRTKTTESNYWIKGRLWLILDTYWELRYPWNELATEVQLDGTGVESLNYIATGWHHMAISRNTSNGITFCIDGNFCYEGVTASSPAPTLPFQIGINRFLNGFAIDEIAVYNRSIPPALLYKHYMEAINRSVEYTFTVPTTPVPAPVFPPKRYDMKDFAPGAIIPSGNPTKGVNLTALEQLTMFPDPQYPRDNDTMALFKRNFNWMSPGYLAGRGQPGIPPEEVFNTSLEIQKVLYQKWHYGVVFSNLRTCCSVEDQKEAASFAEYAKAVDVIILRLQTEGGTQLRNRTLPDGCFLQDAEGHFLNGGGAKVPKDKATLRPLLHEDTAAAAGCPGSVFYPDGEKFNTSLQNAQALLEQYGLQFDRINNDGEAINIIGDAAMAADPIVAAEYSRSGLPNWLTYWSAWRLRMSGPTFSDLFMNDLNSGKFTQYQIQGTNPYFGNWTVTRHIMNRLKNDQFYSCADFYPTNPATVFSFSRGPWHGIGWMKEVRRSEIANGNPWWSPFVAAGWSGASEHNIRPGQWLGLMKLFSVWGAEFFYAGFFSTAKPFPPSQNWIWQAAIPSYAQAVTAHYADVFFNGTFVGWPSTGYSNVWCAVRKGHTARSGPVDYEYIVVMIVQNIANWEGNAPLVVDDVTVLVDDAYLFTATARRQGSVYRYIPSQKYVEQLDAWHEASHPAYWGRS